jgi:hypothetical protein
MMGGTTRWAEVLVMALLSNAQLSCGTWWHAIAYIIYAD